jgi:hypothetical protein
MEVIVMGEQPKRNQENRVSAFISPEAKAMLTTMAHQWFPNLHRPVGSALDRIIREAYAKVERETRNG